MITLICKVNDMKDTDERREEFVQAAEKLFKEKGIIDTTINAIVKELDVAKGLFYYYFDSKDDVIEAISEKYNNDFRKAIERSLKQDDYSNRMDDYIKSVIVSFQELCSNLRGDNEDIDLTILSSRSLDDAKQTASKILEELLDEGKEKGKISVENARYYANVIIGGIADLSRQEDINSEDIYKLIKDLINKLKED